MITVQFLTSPFMKVFKIITHPFLLITIFLFILISGEHWGGFYLLYLLLALPHGGIHSIIAITGISMLIISFYRYRKTKSFLIEPILNTLGSLLLVLSLILFFYNDKQGYNDGTFHQVIPLITLGIFSLVTLFFITDNIYRLTKTHALSST